MRPARVFHERRFSYYSRINAAFASSSRACVRRLLDRHTNALDCSAMELAGSAVYGC